MPKHVDHDERRRVLAHAAADIVAAHGLDALTFRELAAKAGVSVALVQHYFGSKADLLVHTLDRQSDEIGARVTGRLEALGPDASPGSRILAVAEAFLPTDDLSRRAVVVYLSFAAGALTDESLRTATAFARGEELRAFIAAQLSAAEHLQSSAAREATTVLSLVLGLSLVSLLPGGDVDGPLDAVRRHLAALGLPPDAGDGVTRDASVARQPSETGAALH